MVADQEGNGTRVRSDLDDPAQPRRRRQRSGMTWTALAGLLLLLTLVGLEVWERIEFRFPPDGMTEKAAVVDIEGLGGSRGSAPNLNVLVVRLENGSTQRVLFEDRLFGNVDPGDPVTVYQENGKWHTPDQYSWGGIALYGAFFSFLLLLTWVWFHVRRLASV